jgi:hypothetical protein
MARHNSIFAAAACAAIALSLAAAPAQANITWQWNFESEAGTFVTDGSLVGGVAPAGTYTADPDSLNVTSSSLPSLVGATFMQNQTPQGLVWDGSSATQFWREGGAYTNGMNFFLLDWSYRYCFNTPVAFVSDLDYVFYVGGPLTLRPQSAVLVPVPGSICLVVMGLLSIRRLRSR